MSRESEIGVSLGGLAPLPVPAAGLVRIRAVDNPALGFTAELNGLVVPSGYGKWEQTERPGKLPITSYNGLDPLVLPIPMLLDRWQSGRSIEPEIKVLETMLGRHGAQRASVVIVEGRGIPFSYERDQSLRFVLSEPSWDDDVRTTGQSGERCYASLTITATQHSSAALVVTNDRRWFKATKKYNTLRKIAKHVGKTTKTLVTLNDGRKGISKDPDHTIKPGIKVRIA